MNKGYYELLKADPETLNTEEMIRKGFCETIPLSVVAILSTKSEEIRKEVIRLEKLRDEILDFINGIYYSTAVKDIFPKDTEETEYAENDS